MISCLCSPALFLDSTTDNLSSGCRDDNKALSVCLELFPKYDHESSTHPLFPWTLSRAKKTTKAYPGPSGWGTFHEGELPGGEGLHVLNALPWSQIYHSSQLTHQIFTPPFPLSFIGLIQ